MELIREFDLVGNLDEPLPIGDVPTGTRMFYNVNSGHLKGDRLDARILGGGEWALITADGYIRIDVRIQAETHDGAFIYIQYNGLLRFDEAVQAALADGSGTDFGDAYFYINPRIETGDPRYAWLNTTFFVGQGRMLPGQAVEYRVWRPAD